MWKENAYLISVALFAIAAIIGLIVMISGQGHWTQVAIPLGLMSMVLGLWWRERTK